MNESEIKHKAEIPSDDEYQAALEIVDRYQSEQKRLYQLRVESFRKDLTEYFANNLFDGYYRIEEFDLEGTDIIPTVPDLDESYSGKNDKDIKELCKKHNVNFSIIYWCYPK